MSVKWLQDEILEENYFTDQEDMYPLGTNFLWDVSPPHILLMFVFWLVFHTKCFKLLVNCVGDFLY